MINVVKLEKKKRGNKKNRRISMEGVARKKRILVVDDEPNFVKVIKRRLETYNYKVITACNAEECFQTVKKEHPDLVLLDIMMPGLDGIMVCSKLRRTSEVPVIIVTGLHDNAVKHDAGLFGSFEYITKPVDDNELKSKIEKVLERKKKKKGQAT